MSGGTAEDRRTYHREWARRRRAKKLSQARLGRRTCPKRYGKYGTCGGVLEVVVMMGGRTRTTCPRCERFDRGLCECGRPVYGQPRKARRCRECQVKEKQEAIRRYRVRHHAEVLARARKAYKDPEVRRRHCAYKVEWRKKNRWKVLMQKRRARLAGKPGGWSTREKYEAYHRRYREAHREERRQLALAQYYREHPERPRPVCKICGCEIEWIAGQSKGRPPTRCDACAPARDRRRRKQSYPAKAA